MMGMQPGLHPGQPGARSPGAADPGFPRMMGPGNAGNPRGVYPPGQYPQMQQMPGQFMKMNPQVSLSYLLSFNFSPKQQGSCLSSKKVYNFDHLIRFI